jgi:O-antigen ligase
MSKRKPSKQPGKTAKESSPVTTTPVSKKQKTVSANGGLNSMTNWLLLLVLLLPVLYSSKTMDPVITIRFIFLSAFVLLFVLFFYAWRKTTVASVWPLLIKIIFISGAGFIVWNMVSMSSAINAQEGYYEMAKQLLCLTILFLVCIIVNREESQLLKLCKTLLWVCILHGMVGILQYYEKGFTEVPGANAKPYGLMANRNLFGSAQAFLLPFVMYVLYKGNKIWKYISGIALIILVISLLLSQTRSAWLAAIVVIILSLLMVLIFSPVNRKKWTIASLAGIAGIAVLTFLLLSADNEGSLLQDIKERTLTLPGQDGSATQSEGNVNERIKIWNKTWQLVKDKPVTGAGPGNWKIAIPSYGTEGLAWATGKYSPDRPHNIYLQVAAETGIPGALFYFGIWILIAAAGIKVVLRPQSEEQRIIVILMLSGLAAVACDGLFSFPTERIEHSLYQLLMGGTILGCFLSAFSKEKTTTVPLKKPLLWVLVAIPVYSLFIGIKKHNFEITLGRVKSFENLKRYQEMADEAKKGKDLYITLGADIGISMELKRSIALKELKLYEEALKEISIARRYHPNSTAVWNTEGTIYTELKQYDKAIASYQQAQKITPHYDVVLKNLGTNYFLVNDYANCISTLEQVPVPRGDYYEQMLTEAKRRMTPDK